MVFRQPRQLQKGFLFMEISQWDETLFVEKTASGVAMVDFFATWCGPCKAMMSVLEKVADEFSGQSIEIGKIDIEQFPALAARFKVRTVPTFIVFKAGEVQSSLVGVQSQTALANALRKALE